VSMVSSVIRRKLRRHFGGVCKTARGFRWSYPIPWGDSIADGKGDIVAMKAKEGAERSLGSPRRKRGLRLGKARSRGGKPRRSPITIRPKSSDDTSSRSIVRACVQLDYWYEKEDAFVKRIRRFPELEDWVDVIYTKRGTRSVRPNLRYLAARAGWDRIRKGMLRGSKALAPRCCSFRHLLESRVGVFSEEVDLALKTWLQDYVFFRDTRRELEIDPLSYDWIQVSDQNPLMLEQHARLSQASRIERTAVVNRPPSSLTRGKPKGKRERPRELIKEEPYLVTNRSNPCCSHCGGPAFSWDNHRCVQAWRRQQKVSLTGGS
jgi:hypothetical protein